MRIKESRILSFIAISVIYIICALVGLGQYSYLPFSTPINLLIADTVATIVCFIFSLIFKNSSVYDPYWSVAPIVILIGFAIANTAPTNKSEYTWCKFVGTGGGGSADVSGLETRIASVERTLNGLEDFLESV